MSVESVIHANEITEYTESLLIPPTPAFTHAYSNTSAHGIPEIALSPSQGKFISLLSRICQAENILEIGTLGGYSALWFAQALNHSGAGGKLTSVEINPDRRDVAIENLEYAGVKIPEQVDILLGAGLDVLPRLEEEIDQGRREKYDLIFIDADWDNQWAYFDWGVKLSKGKGSVLYVDNVVRQLLKIGAVGPTEHDTSVTNLVEMVGKDERVDATVMQIVGGKDHDGFMIACVK
jgi:predicted O-methyltransferase YrrM